jgi:IS5 family transposase
VFGDSAYRSAANEATLKGRGLRSRIHVRAARGHPLSKAKAAANRAKSRIRARIEPVFGAQETAPGGRIVRTIGIVRARIKIGLQNLAYNMRRLGDARTDGRRMRTESSAAAENKRRADTASSPSAERVKKS